MCLASSHVARCHLIARLQALLPKDPLKALGGHSLFGHVARSAGDRQIGDDGTSVLGIRDYVVRLKRGPSQRNSAVNAPSTIAGIYLLPLLVTSVPVTGAT